MIKSRISYAFNLTSYLSILNWNRQTCNKQFYLIGLTQSSRSGNESFLTYFRFLSSHTTVRAVRHTAV